jgi:hypothetical protein
MSRFFFFEVIYFPMPFPRFFAEAARLRRRQVSPPMMFSRFSRCFAFRQLDFACRRFAFDVSQMFFISPIFMISPPTPRRYQLPSFFAAR